MRALAIATTLAAVVGVAAYLLLSDSEEEPGWTSAPGTVLVGGSCESSAPDLGFSSLPPIPEPDFAFAGSVDFGVDGRVPRVSLYEPDGRVVARGEYYSVSVSDRSRRRPATRGWSVSARMLALDANGAPVEEVSHDRVPPLSSNGWRDLWLSMRVGDDPGFYRLDLRLDGAGPRPRRYSLYLKAVDPKAEARLAISGRRFRVGQSVEARIENLGSEEVQFGAGMGLGKVVDGKIVAVPEEVARPLWLSRVPGGEVTACESLELDRSLSPGRYVVGKGVTTRAEPRGYNDHLLVSSEFEIID